MAFCQKCGAELAEGAAFCPSCGTAVGTAGTGRKQEYTGVVKKCPNCGEVIPNGLATKCPSCGFELNKTEVAKGIKEFTDALRNAPDWRDDEGEPGKESIINNYVIPNNKEDILEFLLFCVPEMDNLAKHAGGYNSRYETWRSAYQRGVDKAKMLFSGDAEFLAQVAQTEQKVKVFDDKIEKAKEKFKRKDRLSYILWYGIPGILILFGIVKCVL